MSSFAEFIWTHFEIDDCTIPSGVKYVIDGGALLHGIPWERGTTFRCLVKKYTDYVKSRMEKPWLFLTGMTLLQPKI